MPGSRSFPAASNRTNGVTRNRSWGILVAVLAIAAYLIAFYAVDSRRRLLLGFLLVPEELIGSWVDGDWSRFGLLLHLNVFGGACVIWIVAAITGWLLLNLIGVDRRFDRFELIVFSLATGLSFWSTLCLALGLVGMLNERWAFGAATFLIGIAAAWRWRANRTQRSEISAPIPTGSADALSVFGKAGLVLCVPLLVVIMLGGILPATHFDVREYHLQVPKEWYQQGRVTFLPHNVYGNMPLGATMHAVLGMNLRLGQDSWWWGALIGKVVVAGFAPLGAAGVFLITRRFISTDAGAWAAFVYLSTPWIGHVSMTGLIDGVVACYVILAVAAALLGKRESERRSDDSASADWRLFALSGGMAGSAVACKYPALLFLVVPLGLMILLLPLRRVHWVPATAFAIAVTLSCGLWFGKNAVMAGNPTYPLLFNVFGGRSWDAEKDARWTRAHGPPRDAAGRSVTPHFAWDTLRLLALTSDHHSPWLVPLAAIGAWAAAASAKKDLKHVVAAILGLITFAVLTWWLLTHRLDRFLVPVLPLAAVVAGIGVVWTDDLRWRRAIVMLGAWCCLSTFLHISSGYAADNRFLVSLADLRTDISPDREHPTTRINNGHRWLNENVQPGYRALMVGEAQVFDLEVPILYNTCFDSCNLELLLRGRNREERAQALRDARISHIFVSWYELRRYRQPGNYGYSAFPTQQLFHDELVREQGLLRPVPLPMNPDTLQIFEVVGWQANPPTEEAPGS